MKKAISVLIVLVMTLALTVSALAAGPSPVARFGFDGDEGMTLTGGSLTTDSERGGVLTLTGGAKGASSASIDTDLFSKTDWADGMTVAFWVKPANADPGISPLYSLNIVDHDSEGYIATTDSLEIAINTDGNSGQAEYPRVWADPAAVDATAQPVLEAGKWQHVAVTLSSTEMVIYLNGQEYSKPALGPSSANFKLFVDQIKYCYGFQLGGWNCGWWDEIGSFAGSYDDFYVFNTALSAADVQTVMNSSFDDMASAKTESGSSGTVIIVAVVAVVAVIAVVAVVLVSKKKKPAGK